MLFKETWIFHITKKCRKKSVTYVEPTVVAMKW